jgi:hypothetical protein
MAGYGLFLTLCLAIVPADEQAKGAAAKMRIELDAFSGRENPSWALSGEQAKEFATLFESLGADDSKKEIRDGLGYRGFRITGFRDYDEVRVWNGIVRADRAGKISRWHDNRRGLERFLLKTSKAHLEEPVYKYAASEVEKD